MGGSAHLDFLQQTEIVEHLSGSQNDARERVFSQSYRKSGLLANTLVQIPDQRAASGEDDALVGDIGRKFGRSPFKNHTNRVHDNVDALVEGLADQLFASGNIMPLVADLPAGVEVTLREAPDRKLLFVLNTEDATVELSSLPPGTDLLTGKTVDGTCSLGPHGGAVIRY